ncbi:MAG: ABC transporter ATP-binding protein [Leptolyngbyaceae bacterium]|nr:ABC transporter ATP-binding protein [Leptolyngbyaceae bacterium]
MTLSLMRFSRSGTNRSGQLLSTNRRQSPDKVCHLTQAANPALQGGQAIAAQHINMVYHSGTRSQAVLKEVSLSIEPGTIQLLMGPSGSGKTTLLSILGGILSPTDGHVSLLGTDITTLSKHQLAKFRLHNIGFIFQGFNLFDALTATENIMVALKMRGMKPRQARQEALYWLEQVGLSDKAHHLPKSLSGGQKQRVAIARALAGNPALIMADEPTAALDSHSGQMVIEMLCNLAKQSDRTVLMVTHDPRIQNVADQVTYLEDGQLQSSEVGTANERTMAQPQTWPQSA